MSRVEQAKEYFRQGFNCSQSVALAFADVVNVEEKELSKLALPFGGGMGRLRLTCGAISGMAAIAGLLLSGEENTPENKKNVYAIIQTLCAKFQERNGSLICADLLSESGVTVEKGGVAEPRTEQYYKKRPCVDLVGDATEILEDYLKEIGKL